MDPLVTLAAPPAPMTHEAATVSVAPPGRRSATRTSWSRSVTETTSSARSTVPPSSARGAAPIFSVPHLGRSALATPPATRGSAPPGEGGGRGGGGRGGGCGAYCAGPGGGLPGLV